MDISHVRDLQHVGKHATGIHMKGTLVCPHATTGGHALHAHAIIHAAPTPVLQFSHVWVHVYRRAQKPARHARARGGRAMLQDARVRVLRVTSLPVLIRAGIRAMIPRAGIHVREHAGIRAINRAYHNC